MGDAEYEKQYLEQKKKSKEIIFNLKKTKDVQAIYHNLMGTPTNDTVNDDSSKE